MAIQAKSLNVDVHQEPWFRIATRCAAEIRQQCGLPDSRMEDRILRVFRSALRPRNRVGRKPDSKTAKAAAMWKVGMQQHTDAQALPLQQYLRRLWQAIYSEVFPYFDNWDNLTRQYHTGALRRNVKACLRRQGCKSGQEIRVPTQYEIHNRVLSPNNASARK